MRKMVLILVISSLLLVSMSGLVMARAMNWRPVMNSPVDIPTIHEQLGTPAVEQVPDNPWQDGFPEDAVPDHPVPGDNGP